MHLIHKKVISTPSNMSLRSSSSNKRDLDEKIMSPKSTRKLSLLKEKIADSSQEVPVEFSDVSYQKAAETSSTEESVAPEQDSSDEIQGLKLNKDKECLSPIKTLEEYSLGQILHDGKCNIFLKKLFIFGKKEKYYAPVYQFFNSQRIFSAKPEASVKFICKICKSTISARIGEPSNLHSHLEYHDEFKVWHDFYEKEKISL